MPYRPEDLEILRKYPVLLNPFMATLLEQSEESPARTQAIQYLNQVNVAVSSGEADSLIFTHLCLPPKDRKNFVAEVASVLKNSIDMQVSMHVSALRGAGAHVSAHGENVTPLARRRHGQIIKSSVPGFASSAQARILELQAFKRILQGVCEAFEITDADLAAVIAQHMEADAPAASDVVPFKPRAAYD